MRVLGWLVESVLAPSLRVPRPLLGEGNEFSLIAVGVLLVMVLALATP